MKDIFTINNIKVELGYHCDKNMVEIIINEVFDRQFYKKAFEYIKDIKNPVVLDVGAFIGITPLYFLRHKSALIYAIEANPDIFQYLKQNIHSDRVMCSNVAIGGANHKIRFGKSDTRLIISPYEKYEQFYEVTTVTIKKYMEHFQIPHINVLKMDIEGGEYESLLCKDFQDIKENVDSIIIEGHNMRDVIYSALPAVLRKLGYKAKLLPFKNMIVFFNYELKGVQGRIEYKVPTIVWATRK